MHEAHLKQIHKAGIMMVNLNRFYYTVNSSKKEGVPCLFLYSMQYLSQSFAYSG